MKKRLPRFNLAALPQKDLLCQAFFKISAHFQSIAKGYCLQPKKSWPHVSLCHFRARDEAEALTFIGKFLGKKLTLQCAGTYALQGTQAYEGTIWIGYSVERHPALINMQGEVVDLLARKAPEIFHHKGDGYFPHITLLRVNQAPTHFNLARMFKKNLIGVPLPFQLRLGLSDENGQFLRTVDGLS